MKLFAILAITLAMTGHANAACRQALIFALDVSSSVDATEYALQVNGLAGALLDPDVQAVLLSQPQAPISLSVFEWSGRYDQRLVLGWRAIENKADLLDMSTTLASQTRPTTTRPTAIGHALQFAGQQLQKIDCWNLTVDISGDGKNNDGFQPAIGKQGAIYDLVTVNGLVIGTDAPSPDRIVENEIGELTSYFRHVVIHGADAFIETALGFEDFEAAMKRKLLRELSISVSDTGPFSKAIKVEF
jgi:hypothetical protein